MLQGQGDIVTKSQEHPTVQISKLCRNFLHLSENGTIVVSHSTVRDYLSLKLANQVDEFLDQRNEIEETQKLILDQAHQISTRLAQKTIATECLTLLNYYTSVLNNENESHADGDFPSPLLKYAASEWFKHIRACADENGSVPDDLLDIMKKFFDPSNSDSAFRRWLSIFNPDHPQGRTSTDAGPLYYAVLLDLPDIIQFLLGNSASPNTGGGRMGNPLQLACYLGQQPALSMMLTPETDVNVVDDVLGTPLQAAIAGRHISVVRKLLDEHNVDVNARGGLFGSALQIALALEEESVLQALVSHGVQYNTERGKLWADAWAAIPAVDRREAPDAIRKRLPFIDKSFHLAMEFPNLLQSHLTLLAFCVALLPGKQGWGELPQLPKRFSSMFRERMHEPNLESVGFVPERVPWLILCCMSLNGENGKKEREETELLLHMIDHHEMFLRQFPEPALPADLRRTILELFTRILQSLLHEIYISNRRRRVIQALNLSLVGDYQLVEMHEKVKKMEDEAKLTATAERTQTGNRDILAAMRQMAREISELKTEIRDLTAAVNQLATLQPGIPRGR
jgi:ankyrin repeat protein